MASVVQTAYGEMRVTDTASDLIGRSLERFGSWCASETDFVSTLLRPTDFLWDGGAYLGTFSLGVQARSPVKVLAIEANPDVVPLLASNLAANKKAAYGIASVALGPRNGFAELEGSRSNNLGASRFRRADERPAGPTAIKAVTLRDMRAWHGDYSALKLDIEGAEFEVLKGDADYIRAAKPLLWVECNEDARSLDLADFFSWAGLDPLFVAVPALPEALDGISPEVCEGFLLGGWRTRCEGTPDLPQGRGFVRPIGSRRDLRDALWDTPRWADAGWDSLVRSELVARLSRLTLGQRFQDFI
ncbi:FkbM family methyltransferase [Palleronia sp. KMU-117]|uniref:FkbM family methyltransferase n=1 Tax=Palleronia sp. KMU-117 TaxID=3434108 RepID=UPI003D72C40B